jgi:hypothetical protein
VFAHHEVSDVKSLVHSIRITALALLVASPVAAQSYPVRCGTGLSPDERGGYIALPRGDVFCPLVADPKATRSFASLLRERDTASTNVSGNIASVGIGDVFGLGRWNGELPGDGVQLSIAAGVFAQFDLETPSYDMLNADYIVGIPLTIRRGNVSARVRLYHQSSHLGDEYLLREPPARQDRENLSFESFEAIVSLDANILRLYGGGEIIFNREPQDLERSVLHGGIELRPMFNLIPLGRLGGFKLVAATDLKASQEQDWDPSVSARAGLEYDQARDDAAPGRRWGLFFEYYRGPSPYGQFFRERVRYVGAGVHFGGF